MWRALASQAAAQRALHRDDLAEVSLNNAISAIETLRIHLGGDEAEQQHFLEDKMAPYNALVDLLVSQKRNSEAFAISEQAKARILADVLQKGRFSNLLQPTQQEAAHERKLNGLLISLNTQLTAEYQRVTPNLERAHDLIRSIATARLEYKAFRADEFAKHPDVRIRRGEVKPTDMREVNRLYGGVNAAFLSYTVTDDKTFIFVVTPSLDHPEPMISEYTLAIPRPELTKRIRDLRDQVDQPSIGYRKPAERLYDTLIRPVEFATRSNSALCFIPDAEIWNVPFQALMHRGRFLVEDHAVSYAPSLAALYEMSPVRNLSHAPRPNLLAFGNPSLDVSDSTQPLIANRGSRLVPLPFAEAEVRHIRDLYGADHSRIYIGPEASENNAKADAGSYDVLHFAVHGIVDNASPMNSHLVLAQNKGDHSNDGLLEAWEIMQLNLHADLTVLSACDLAGGPYTPGEGIIGMTWALMASGCPSTVVAQWGVYDESTSQFMIEFHRQYLSLRAEDKHSKAEALRGAARKLIVSKQFRLPYYWAPFVLVGCDH